MLCLPAPEAGTRGASHFGNSSHLPQPVVQRALPELPPEVSAPSCVLIVRRQTQTDSYSLRWPTQQDRDLLWEKGLLRG